MIIARTPTERLAIRLEHEAQIRHEKIILPPKQKFFHCAGCPELFTNRLELNFYGDKLYCSSCREKIHAILAYERGIMVIEGLHVDTDQNSVTYWSEVLERIEVRRRQIMDTYPPGDAQRAAALLQLAHLENFATVELQYARDVEYERNERQAIEQEPK